MKWDAVVAGVVLAGACLLPAASRAAETGPNVVLITADTLRADHLHCYGYFRATSPAIDELARGGLLFENVIAPMSSTLPSHVSMMTSLYPLRHGVVSNLHFFSVPDPDHGAPRTAAEIFRSHGYRTAAFTSASPVGAATGIAAGFDVFDGVSSADGGAAERPAEATVRLALEWIAAAEPPFFLWVHFFDPHRPYRAPQPYDRAFVDEPRLFDFIDSLRVAPSLRRKAAALSNRYDGEILYMDGQIGLLVRALRRRGLYDDSLVVFTGDHGEGLMQHGFQGHGIVWNEQLRVPLILKPARSRPISAGRRTDLASLVDLLPTIASATGLPLPEVRRDGIDLLSAQREAALSQREIRVQAWAAKLYTLTTAEWKYFDDANGEDKLFHLSADPHEKADVLERHPEIGRRMEGEIAALVGGKETPMLRLREDLPAAAREQLRQLGYIE